MEGILNKVGKLIVEIFGEVEVITKKKEVICNYNTKNNILTFITDSSKEVSENFTTPCGVVDVIYDPTETEKILGIKIHCNEIIYYFENTKLFENKGLINPRMLVTLDITETEVPLHGQRENILKVIVEDYLPLFVNYDEHLYKKLFKDIKELVNKYDFEVKYIND